MNTRSWKFAVLMSVFTLMLLTAAAHACPMCKDSIPASDAQQAGSLPGGFNNSVYILLIGFLSVLGSLCALIVKAVRTTGVKPAAFPVVIKK